MGYPYEDLSDGQFEDLVVEVCRKLFGIGVVAFAAGVDGGRDARFTGTAEIYPSTAEPWSGATIIQAKHTNATNAHVNDPTFSSDAGSSVISEEIPRIKKLVSSGELDNYVIFTNRRLGANADAKVRSRIEAEAVMEGRPCEILGIEFLDAMLRSFPDVVQLANVDPIDSPISVSSYEIAEVIIAISEGLDEDGEDAPVVDRVSFEKKNQINKMSEQFANTLLNRYLAYTKKFDRFLASPENSDSLARYNDAVDDFQLKVIAKRKEYQSFDEVFNYLVDLLLDRDAVLGRNRRLTRAMVFYMYWKCDLGEVEHADTK